MNLERGNTVFLLVGQRGSGKSFYGKKLKEKRPDLQMVSRDEILIRRFGSEDTSPYSGATQYVEEVMFRLLRRKLATQSDIIVLLDHWTGSSRERRFLLDELRRYGAKRVVALYFTTPLPVVETWFWLKPGIARISEMREPKGQGLVFFSDNAPKHDYELFHEFASNIDSDGFDEVIRIDPQKEPITLI